MPRTEPQAAPWHQSLRWRLTLSFVGLLAVLLVVAGGIEYGLLQGAILSSRGQSLEAALKDGRAVLAADIRARTRAGRPRPAAPVLAGDLARLLAAAGDTTAVYSANSKVVASAAPASASGTGVRTGVSVPPPSESDLVAATQYDTVIGPTEVGAGGSAQLAELLPLTGRLGRQLGAVELAEPYGPIQSELTAAALVVSLGSAAVLLVALLLGLAITSWSLGPLRRLSQTARALGGGDLAQRSGLRPRADEVGQLARVFDEMAQGVERTVREREESERRMRQFIADASHELRTPLTAIKGYLDVLQREPEPSPEMVRRALPVMSQEAERMRALVMDLLTLARSDEGQSLTLQPVDLGAFLESFLAERRSAAPVRLAQGPAALALADPTALTAIVGNLQQNAERHGRGAAIEWSTGVQGEMVGFRCRDQGPGISPQDLPHVFERFYRAESSRSRQDGGSGLGLAIVHALVEAQGGRISVESVPGKGATFQVLLQRASSGQ